MQKRGALLCNSRGVARRHIPSPITDKEPALDAMAKFEERPLATEVVKPTASETRQNQEKEGKSIRVSEKIDKSPKQTPAEPLDWNPINPAISTRL